MTDNACSFVSPLSFSTLSKNKVITRIIDDESWNNHVELGLWADAMVIAPATASTLAKMASGQCDNMLVATYLSAKCPVHIAPAMDLDMWKHPAMQNNIRTLQSYGNHIIPVGYGELASGLVGDGRMAEPEQILQFLMNEKEEELRGKRVMVTAGPTIEAIDPVRFIGNHSTGKMGLEIARECADRGAEVDLILGPVTCKIPLHSRISIHRISSAGEMHQEAQKYFTSCDAAIFAAAVADYTPKEFAVKKIKKTENDLQIELKRTVDIAASLGSIKKPGQISIGFALETHDEELNARDKLNKKNFDFIVLNSLNDEGAGFAHDTNRVKIIDRSGDVKEYGLKSKKEVASDIIDLLVQRMDSDPAR